MSRPNGTAKHLDPGRIATVANPPSSGVPHAALSFGVAFDPILRVVSTAGDGGSERGKKAAEATAVVNDVAVAVRDRDGRLRHGGAGLGPILMGRNDLFGSRPAGNGRVKVYGCSPGCLLISIAVSIALTIFLNVLIRLL